MSASQALTGAGIVAVRSGQPLSLRPAGSVPIGLAAALAEDYEGEMTFD